MRKLGVVLLSILIGTVLSVTAHPEGKNMELNYFGDVDGKLRILLVGANEDFRKVLKFEDSEDLFDHDFRPESLAETDLAVIFLNSWDDARLLKGEWGRIREDISSASDETLNRISVYNVKDNITGEIMDIVVSSYNTEKIKTNSYNCYARDIINKLVMSDDEYKKNNILYCDSVEN